MKKEAFEELLQSISQAGEIRKGLRKPSRRFSYPPARIQSIRTRWKVSQRQFATMIGVSANTLENWEQGRRSPRGPAKALLRIVEREPEAAFKALQLG